MSARILPATPPYPERVKELLDQRKSLTLFNTLARNERLLRKFFSGSLLDPASNVSLRNREILIDRITALSGSEYEWGVHVAIFGQDAGFTEEQIVSTAHGNASDPCWNAEESALIAACDQLHETCNIDDSTWDRLKEHFSNDAILEILMLAGRYRVVSYLTNAVRMPLETWQRRFPSAQ
jgi:alkylhydroperoxidase family enzyme